MKTGVFTFVLILSTFSTMAYADELFVPSDMLLSEKNHGLFIRDDPTSPVLVLFASDNDIAKLPESIYLDIGQNHALFPISLYGTGDVNVIANIGTTFWNTTSSIHDGVNSEYRLFPIFPEKSITSDIEGVLYLVDDLFSPVYLDEDTVISLVCTNMDCPESVTVKSGQSHVFFSVDVFGDATLTAYSEKAVSESIGISYGVKEHRVHLGVAPDIIAPNSFGYAFVWITADDATITRQPHPISSQLHVTDNNILSIDGLFSSEKSVVLQNGFYYQKIFSHEPGNSTITVSVPGYGAASESVIVRENALTVDTTITPLQQSEYHTPNHIVTEIFPPATDSDSYLVASMYYVPPEHLDDYYDDTLDEYSDRFFKQICNPEAGDNRFTELSSYCLEFDEDGKHFFKQICNPNVDKTQFTELSSVCFRLDDDGAYAEIYPVYGVESAEFSITSQNLIHDKSIQFWSEGVRTQSMLVPIRGSVVGNHIVSVSSSNLPVSSSSVEITSSFTYGISIVSLPKTNTEQYPIFALSVVDSTGAVVDPHYVFGDILVNLISDDAEFEKDVVRLSKPVTIIYGTSDLKHPTITVIAQNQNIVSTHQSSYQSSLEIDIQIPQSVHSGEQFPVFAYLLADGKPVSAINDHIQSNCTRDTDFLFSCDSSSQFTVFDNIIGFATEKISVFKNSFDIDNVQVDFGTDTLYIGGNHTISIASDEIDFDVISDIPYTVLGDAVELHPERHGTYDVLVQFTKPGYLTQTKSQEFTISDDVLVNIRTVENNNSAIESSVDVFFDGENHTVLAPTSLPIKRGSIHVEFPQSVTVGTTGYAFEKVTFAGEIYNSNILDLVLSKPSTLEASYKKVIRINVAGGIGSGLYDYGSVVSIDAPSRDVVWFLIRDSFHQWSYLPAGYDVYSKQIDIAADESFDSTVVYRSDYSGLVGFVMVVSFGFFAFLRKDRIIGIIRTYTEK